MEIESDKSETQKIILTPEELQKKKAEKQKRKLKGKQQEEMRIQQYNLKNLMVKDLSYEKKIFLFTDLIIDLDMFNDSNSNGRPTKFDPICSWRPPVRITQENNIINIDLDTSADGLQTFEQVSKILQSIPNKDAYELGQQIQQYNKGIQNYLEKSIDFFYIFNLISKDQKSNYSIKDYFDEILHQKLQKAKDFINEKYQQHKYVSYMIKTRRRNNQVVTKYGYSKELLSLLGLDSENMYRLLYQNGPLIFYSNKDKIERLKNSLIRRTENLGKLSQLNEDIILPNQTIITFDDLKFNCDIKMYKNNLSQENNYFIQSIFMIQLAAYDINDTIINQINNLRQNQSESIEPEQDSNCVYYGLDYESQSEMFIQKFYSNN